MPGNRRNIILAIFVFSGATGLVYEVVWSRMLTLIFGVASFAVSTVLAAFMGGLALGAFLFGRYIERAGRPLLIYGILEISVGLYALVMPFLLDGVQTVYLQLFQSLNLQEYPALFALIRFLLAGVVLLPPTCLMGGTLPILVHWWGGRSRRRGTASARTALLYGLNTGGAVAGTLLAGFALLPALGIRGTTLLTASINVCLGLLVLTVPRGALTAKDEEQEEAPPPSESDHYHSPPSEAHRRWAAAAFALSGAISLSYEIYWTRILVLIIGPSAYAFSLMLTAFLAGLALGSAATNRLVRREGDRFLQFGILQLIIALSSAGAMLLFSRFPYWFIRLSALSGDSASMVSLAPIPLLLVTMLVPTFAMGATFPVVADLYRKTGRSLARSVGEIYTFNTLGGIVGSFLAGFVLLPLLGVRTGLIVLISLNALLGFSLLFAARPGKRRRTALFTAVAGLIVLTVIQRISGAPLWDQKKMTIGPFQTGIREIGANAERLDRYLRDMELLYYDEGLAATITVRRQGNTLTLQTNGKTDASSGGDQRTQILLGQLPMLFHKAPREALVIGLASGISAASVLSQGATSLVIAELEAGMVEASRFFRPWNDDVLSNPAVSIRVEDARNYLLSTDRRFDVVVSEPSNPWISGVNNLFTLEAFQLLKERMNRGGILAQWFHYYGMSTDDLLALLNTFSLVFDYVEIFEAQRGDLIILGSDSPFDFNLSTIRSRMESEGNDEKMRLSGLPDLYDLLALYLFPLDSENMPDPIRNARVNTDDNMLLEFSAPKHLYSHAGDENRELLSRFRNRTRIYRGVAGEHILLAEGAVRAWDLAGATAELLLEEGSPAPDWNAIHNLKGRILLLRASRESNPGLSRPALAEIDEALAVDSTSSTSHFLKGSALLQLGDPGSAATSFEAALRLGEDPAVVLGFLGLAQENIGATDAAVRSYRGALSLDGSNPLARQGLGRLIGANGETRPGDGGD